MNTSALPPIAVKKASCQSPFGDICPNNTTLTKNATYLPYGISRHKVANATATNASKGLSLVSRARAVIAAPAPPPSTYISNPVASGDISSALSRGVAASAFFGTLNHCHPWKRATDHD